MSDYKSLLKSLETSGAIASSFNRGIEREALRVDPDGGLARSPHPAFLGSKLCNPQITTDFSEAQLELITPVHKNVSAMLDSLDSTHRFVYSGLDEQLLWASSMPCVLSDDDTIPLAQYGTSNLGQLKTTYRRGLGSRYGRAMQTICAVHYNFSFDDSFWDRLQSLEKNDSEKSEYRTKRYFDLMRNFRRFSWLLVYLFGASPAVCNTFVKGRAHNLVQFDEGTLFSEGATSLRNGNLGYQSDTQKGLIDICYNSLSNYVRTLANAVTSSHQKYTEMGLKDGEDYLQVNTNILQSEAEFYSTIRAKRVPAPGENFLEVLLNKGVEYVEVRLLDIDPYEPLGVSEEQIHFLDSFLLYCLLEESPIHDDRTCNLVNENLAQTVTQGRKPGVKLDDGETRTTIGDWGLHILEQMSDIATSLDRTNDTASHTASLRTQIDKLYDPEKTPSAKILADMTRESIPFFRFAMNKSKEHRFFLRERPLSTEQQAFFERMATESVQRQAEIEAADKISFSRYLENIDQDYHKLL